MGVSAGFWMGGGLDGCGDGGRCFNAPGDGGRAFCFPAAGEGVLGVGLGAGEGERFRDDGEAGRCAPEGVCLFFKEGLRAPSADSELLMPLFCRSLLRLLTGPR